MQTIMCSASYRRFQWKIKFKIHFENNKMKVLQLSLIIVLYFISRSGEFSFGTEGTSLMYEYSSYNHSIIQSVSKADTHGLTWQQTSTKLKLGHVSQKIMVCKEVYGSSSVCKKYVKKEKDTLSTIDLSPKWTSISQFFTVDLCGLNFLVFIM